MKNLSYMRFELEKKSAFIGDKTLGKSIKGVAKFVVKHPYLTIGAVAIPTILLNSANKVHGAYDIYNQHGQKSLMNKQLEVLRSIDQKQKVPESPRGTPRRIPRLISEPLM
jgi:hypothetical protein